MTSAKPKLSYEELRAELEVILSELQSEELDVDKALEHYKRGLELTGQLEKYLKTAENQIQELKTKYDTKAT